MISFKTKSLLREGWRLEVRNVCIDPPCSYKVILQSTDRDAVIYLGTTKRELAGATSESLTEIKV